MGTLIFDSFTEHVWFLNTFWFNKKECSIKIKKTLTLVDLIDLKLSHICTYVCMQIFNFKYQLARYYTGIFYVYCDIAMYRILYIYCINTVNIYFKTI